MATRQAERVHVEGHELTITNLDKVLYPETGTTKAQVLDYYAAVAPFLIPAAANRPATRKRWVHGVGTAEEPGEMFFQKNLDPASTPSWVPRVTIKHRHGTNTYPLINNLATLTWLAQIASLELHVPQWQVDAEGRMLPPDRLVLDLDPGPGSGLPECVEVAKLAREILQDMGFDPVPVTSGSKGIHLYVPLDGTQPWEQVSSFARELARSLEADHPDLVVSEQKKSLRHGKVLVDWSQNSGNKTTIVPYSLRGRAHPTVAAPRTWRELLSPSLKHLDYTEVLKRVKQGKDPFSAITGAAGSSAKGGRPPSAADRDGGDPGDRSSRSSAKGGHPPSDADRDGGDPGEGGSRSSARGGARTGRERGDVDDDASATQLAASAKGAAAAKGVGAGVDPRLSAYVGKRDVDRTPEPFPASSGAKPQPGDEQPPGGIFVIQEHHARRYHLDLRLEHNGVLASWALPRGVPETPARNNLAVQTEDHPMEYATFAGVIPKGEYGAGTMSIWDSGTFECEKWRDGKEVIATLTGQPGGGLHGIKRFALIHTGGAAPNQWLIHLMKEQPGGRRLSGGTGSSAANATGGTRTTPARTSSAPSTTASTKAAGSPVSSSATPARTSSAPSTTASTTAAGSPVSSNATPARTSSAPSTTASTKAAGSPVSSSATPARTSSAPSTTASTTAAGSPVSSNATPARTSSAPSTTASTKAAGSPVSSSATPARTSSAPSTTASTTAAGSPVSSNATPARTSSAPSTTASTKAAGSPVSSSATPARTSSAPSTTASTTAAGSPVSSNATPARTSSAPSTTASTKAAGSPVSSSATPARTSSAPSTTASTTAAGSPVSSNATPARTSSAPSTTASTKAAGSPVSSSATPARTSSAPSTAAAGSPRGKASAAAEGRKSSPAEAAAGKAPKPAPAVEPVPIQAPKVTPMLAAAGTAADVRGTDDRQGAWLYELKWDGIRAIITGTRGRIRLMSRNGNEMTATYPELSDASCWPDHDFVADGEIVAVDHSGRPSFGRLQQRMNLVKPGDIERARKLYPVRLMLFDLMYDSGASPADLRDLPLVERRRRLGAFMDRLPPSNCPVHESLVLDHALDDILESAGELGLEGVMAKRADSRYLPGRRSHSWIKLKLERMQEVVVGGWRPGAGVRRGTIGALLVGVPDGDKLRYLGRVGTGFKDWQLKEILERLEQHEQPVSPFHEVPREDAAMARWVEPILVGEVSYGSWTDSDRLRFPVWRGWRPDKEPGEVSVE